MPTITESLQNAANRLDAAVAAVLGLRSEMQALRDKAAGDTTTIINNFLNRPPVVTYFLDEINGNDANDGLTIGKPKKSIDLIMAGVGISSIQVLCLTDITFRSRTITYGSVALRAIQPGNTQRGWIDAQRTINFLGAATNSPAEAVGTFCSGLFVGGTTFSVLGFNYRLPIQPAGQDYPAHFSCSAGTAFSFRVGTLLVDGAGAGSLVGVIGSRSTVFSELTLGSGATGHLFQGVAAGGNPNNQFAYATNVTSA